MQTSQIRRYCELSSDCERLLERAINQQGLSARTHDRNLKLARTIADLEGAAQFDSKHIAETIQDRTSRPQLRGLIYKIQQLSSRASADARGPFRANAIAFYIGTKPPTANS